MSPGESGKGDADDLRLETTTAGTSRYSVTMISLKAEKPVWMMGCWTINGPIYARCG